jgi:hypothetical protein
MAKEKQKKEEQKVVKRVNNSANQFILKRPKGMNKVAFKGLAGILAADLKVAKAEFFKEKD